jgi:hypothetical protein
MWNPFKKKPEPTPEPKPKPRKKSAKEIATEKGEPWINVLGMEVDLENILDGAFELDWNDKWVAHLVRFGYRGKTDKEIVDQWFQDVCRTVALEMYEQQQADISQNNPARFQQRKDLGNGKTEVK